MKRLALAVLTMLLAVPVFAVPAVKVAVGVNGVWPGTPTTDFTKDFEGGAVVSASLSPHISGVAHGFYGFNQNYVRYDAGARVTATDVDNPDFNLYLGIVYRSASLTTMGPSEWAPDAGVGWRPNPKAWPHIILGADAGYGLQSKNPIVYAGLRWRF